MAASRIQGITVEISGDTTKLQTALKGVNTEIKNTQSQLKDIDKLLKLDPGNTELLAQKHRLLGDAVKETKEKLETLKTAAEQANTALANGEITQSQYDGLQREIAETEAKLKSLEEQANQSATALQQISATGEKLQTVGDKVSGVGTKLLPVTGAVAAASTAAVKTAADFESGMSKVSAISGATGSDLDALSTKAREMGAKTKFSASEAASAMEYMAMAGWKTEDMLGGIEGVMNLAAASGEDLATTSDIVTDALTAFGLTASDSRHFADVLAAASSNANTNVSMMGETFKYCAPIAGSLGFSVEDTAEAIGLMANAGIKSTQAGTSLRTIMTNLSSDFTIAGQNIGEVTIATTNADGSMRDLSDILADCRVAFSGLTESEQAAAAESLVGKNAMSGFLALMNAGEGDINKLSSAIDNCDGTAQSMADTMNNNLEGQLTILKSALEELAISFGELLLPAIKNIVSFLQGFVDMLNSMPEGMKQTIMTIALVAAAIGPVLIVVGKVISAVGTIMTVVPQIVGVINTVKTAFAALNLTMLANPIVLIIAAIAALVAAFIYLWNTNEGFRQFWIELWENVKEVAVECWQAITEFLGSSWETIQTTAATVWNGIKEFFSGLWTGIQTIFTTVVTAISDFLQNAWTMIQTVASTVWNGIKEFFSGIWTGIQTIFTTVATVISNFLQGVWMTIQTVTSTIWNGIMNFFSGIWTGIQNVFTTVVTAISNFLQGAWTGIQTVASTIWNAIKTVISDVVNGIKNTISTVWENIKSTIGNLTNGIKDTVGNAFNAMWNAIKSTVSGIYNTIQEGFNNAVSFITGLASSAWQWGADIINGIVDGIRSCISAVTDAVKDVAGTIKSFLHFSVPDEGPLTDFESWMPDFMEGLAHGIERSKGLVKDAVDSVAQDMVLSPRMMVEQAFADGADNIRGNIGYGRGVASGNDLGDMISAIREAVSGISAAGVGEAGDIVIPVYLGNQLLDEAIITAQQRMNLRSGGR